MSELKSDLRFAFLAWALGSVVLIVLVGLVMWATGLRVEW